MTRARSSAWVTAGLLAVLAACGPDSSGTGAVGGSGGDMGGVTTRTGGAGPGPGNQTGSTGGATSAPGSGGSVDAAIPTQSGGAMGGPGPGTGGGSSGGGAAVAGRSGSGGVVGSSGGRGGAAVVGASGGAGASGPTGARSVSTEPNLKIAFAADTDIGATWSKVGALIKAEGAAAVVIAGDMAYDNSSPASWWAATDAALGSSFPVFLAKGNHDDASKWPGLVSVANQRIAGWGAAKEASSINDATYYTTFKGLAVLSIADSGIGDGPKYGSYIQSKFANDSHIWRICTWHKNQQAMQAGGKPDEVGWEPYDACRDAGAIIQTGHEHSYARTKTLTGFKARTVDATCSAADTLCVGPGRSFAQTVGTGGRDSPLRSQSQCTPVWMNPLANSGTCPYWAVIYTASQNGIAGAQFITFNVGGNPKKATGYFKNINGQIVDTFTITAD